MDVANNDDHIWNHGFLADVVRATPQKKDSISDLSKKIN